MTMHEVVHEMVVGECHKPNSEGSGSAWKAYMNARVAGLFLLVLLEYPNDRLVSNLCTLWIGNHHLHANVARFQRSSVPNNSKQTHQNGDPIFKNKESCVGAVSWFSQIIQASKEIDIDERITWVDIEGIPLKLWWENTFNRIAAKWGKILYTENLDVGCFHSKRICILTTGKSNIFESFKIIHQEGNDLKENNSDDPFNLYLLLNKKKNTEKSNNTESLQYPPGFTPCDVKAAGLDKNTTGINESSGVGGEKGFSFCWIKELQKGGYQKDIGLVINCNGGIDQGGGTWVCSGVNLLIILVYAPQEFSEKKMLWDYLGQVITKWNGEVIVMGDFNEVRYKNERYGSVFHAHGADAFNSFISNANLQEISLGGCSFTWCHRSASKMSKLDRFLMLEGLLSANPNFFAITLDRYLSYNRPIMLRESFYDYGPIPFRLFHYWFEIVGFEEMIPKAWCESPAIEVNPMLKLMYKMKYLKKRMHEWNGMRQSSKSKKSAYKKEFHDLETIIDQDGIWIENPNLVKSEFLLHFKNRSQKPCSVRPVLDMTFLRQLFAMQQIDMESDFSYQEIKRAVWDCGVDKSLGPDGFTFGFITRFWSLLEKDVVAAVKYFFTSGTFPKGCNASFIALISKIPNAKMCLRSSRGLVLVNGSPTEEFQFYKGLKQGDPLSPFLFILVMESLHLSFKRVEDA
nr:RNA-directed DNA polymerase, eukaryota [Tanacetum cinerariifolium]